MYCIELRIYEERNTKTLARNNTIFLSFADDCDDAATGTCIEGSPVGELHKPITHMALYPRDDSQGELEHSGCHHSLLLSLGL